MTNRLPTVGADNNDWGTVLNDYLMVGHNANGTPYTITPVSANYVISTESPANVNEVILANATSGAITVTLPDATSATYNNFLYSIKKVDSSAHSVTVATTASQTIDGSTTAALKVQYVSISVVSDGSNWNVV